MGRANPNFVPPPPQNIRRAQRAKEAKHSINNIIPALLKSDAKARKGVDDAKLIVDPPASGQRGPHKVSTGGTGKSNVDTKSKGRPRKGKRRGDDTSEDEAYANAPSDSNASQLSGTKPRNTRDSQESLHGDRDHSPLQISIFIADTLTAAHTLHTAHKFKVDKSTNVPAISILNMASPLRPGGGVRKGATSQEESLCTRCTLLPSLREDFYRLPELGHVFTPVVLVFRTGDTDLPKDQRFYVSCVSAAAIRFPETEVIPLDGESRSRTIKSPVRRAGSNEDGSNTDNDDDDDDDGSNGSEGPSVIATRRFANPSDRNLTQQKMRAVLRTMSANGTSTAVLGAWGCGAYGNPISEIAQLWRKVLSPESTQSAKSKRTGTSETFAPLRKVVFAIKNARMAREFARAWGGNIEVVEQEEYGDKMTVESDDEEAIARRKLRELDAKIQDLERAMRESKFPERYEGVMSVLKKQRAELAANAESDQALDDARGSRTGPDDTDSYCSSEDA